MKEGSATQAESQSDRITLPAQAPALKLIDRYDISRGGPTYLLPAPLDAEVLLWLSGTRSRISTPTVHLAALAGFVVGNRPGIALRPASKWLRTGI